MIEVRNLVKKYGSNTALHGISFSVDKGKIYGFLGPNGAGKSTTMNIISGCLAATSGSVTVNGHDICAEPELAKQSLGYLPEIPPLYTDMTADEYLSFVGEAKGLKGADLAREISRAAELTGVTPVRSRLIRNLSKGYRQRVGIAQAILGDPEVVILDEPTVGLDPKQIIEIRELIRSLGERHTVILSSHILPEVQEVCDHLIIIANGRIVANDTIDKIAENNRPTETLELSLGCGKEKAMTALAGIAGVTDMTGSDTAEGCCEVSLVHDKNTDISEPVYRALVRGGIVIRAMVPRIDTLESIFLSLTADTAAVADEHENEPRGGAGGEKKPADAGTASGSADKKDDDSGYKPLFG